MPNGLENFLVRQKPTPERPLLGQTVLIVEDSRYSSEALRLMCLRSGARVRRADSLSSAKRHLGTYRPGVVIVDIGLPDGSGTALIADLADMNEARPAILAVSGDQGLRDAALAAGADAFLDKPLGSLAALQSAVIAHLPPEARPPGPRLVTDEAVAPDRLALYDDLAKIATELNDRVDAPRLSYLAQFLTGLAQSDGDGGLMDLAKRLRDLSGSRAVPPESLSAIARTLEERIADRAII